MLLTVIQSIQLKIVFSSPFLYLQNTAENYQRLNRCADDKQHPHIEAEELKIDCQNQGPANKRYNYKAQCFPTPKAVKH